MAGEGLLCLTALIVFFWHTVVIGYQQSLDYSYIRAPAHTLTHTTQRHQTHTPLPQQPQECTHTHTHTHTRTRTHTRTHEQASTYRKEPTFKHRRISPTHTHTHTHTHWI